MTPYDNDLIDAYVRQGVLGSNKQPVHLQKKCPLASVCWAALQERAAKPEATELSPPYIGGNYVKSGLVILLENLRDYGGFDLGPDAKKGMRFLGQEATEGFLRGEKILFRGEFYAGTSVWYQSVSYAACWLDAQGILSAKWTPEGKVETKTLHDAMDSLAIIQHVKCSPCGNRSAPSREMWEQCGRHVLLPELSVLRPHVIIVAGTKNNGPYLQKLLHAGEVTAVRSLVVNAGCRQLTVSYEECTGEWGKVGLFIVPHPATPGGKSLEVLKAVRQLMARE